MVQKARPGRATFLRDDQTAATIPTHPPRRRPASWRIGPEYELVTTICPPRRNAASTIAQTGLHPIWSEETQSAQTCRQHSSKSTGQLQYALKT